jgi:hypothetical protein
MRQLFELQTLQFEVPVRPDAAAQIRALRARLPAPILDHYDRLGASGKKGVARLSHQTCSGCHLRVPLNVVLDLKHGDEVRCCDNCGRYLYLEEEPAVAGPEPAAKPVRSRGRKAAEVQFG